MAPELVEIQPGELKFTFELKKQCTCSLQLVNKSNEYVAFKVKTTSPKRYCVRPNTGVILPRSTCDFTVTMQAQRTAPPDMQLKDKFLVQSTVVPFGTMDEDIAPNFFSKENGRYIEEHKLRVILVSPPHSPELQPLNGALKPEPVYEALKQEPVYEALKQEPVYEAPVFKETPTSKDQALTGVENLHPLHVTKDVEDLKLKLNNLEMKLNEADKTITMLREDKSVAIQERDKLQQEIVLLRRKCATRVQVGFPLMFVVFIGLLGVVLGYLLHP